MPIVLVRVDERLVHGQVLEGWVPSTRAEQLIVANDDLLLDEARRMLIQWSVPYTVELVLDGVEQIARRLINNGSPALRKMIIVESPVDALRLKRAGVSFDRLNVGNFASREPTVSLSESVLVGGEQLQALINIIEAGVRVSVQRVPYEKAVDVGDLKESHLQGR
jgi:mannose/fructose/N-acetylgalactosamine-specific phosphotransferase system component IIB